MLQIPLQESEIGEMEDRMNRSYQGEDTNHEIVCIHTFVTILIFPKAEEDCLLEKVFA